MTDYYQTLIMAIAFSVTLTLISKTLPITLLKADTIPQVIRKWLDFVPVAVMAALVGPDILFYDGRLNFSFSNLFLLVSAPVFFVAWKTSNYFITIAVGIGLVIIARYFGYA